MNFLPLKGLGSVLNSLNDSASLLNEIKLIVFADLKSYM